MCPLRASRPSLRTSRQGEQVLLSLPRLCLCRLRLPRTAVQYLVNPDAAQASGSNQAGAAVMGAFEAAVGFNEPPDVELDAELMFSEGLWKTD